MESQRWRARACGTKKNRSSDAAGNTTAAIGKGFCNWFRGTTALALFAAFLVRVNLESLNLLSPVVFSGMLVGGAYLFIYCLDNESGGVTLRWK